MSYLLKNNAYSTLASALASGGTSLAVGIGHGDRFPVVVAPDYTVVTLEDAVGRREIVKITARAAASDVLTIVRAQESTIALNWAAGDVVELRFTAGTLQDSINATDAHIADTIDAHAASAITNVPTGNLAATNVQTALNELDAEKVAIATKDATGGYAGLTLFAINFKNALNTFTSFFANANTAARTYTFQDRSGTIADNTDLSLKADLASPTFTGTPTLPTGSIGVTQAASDNSTKLATTAFVLANVPAAFPTGTRMSFNQTAAPTGWTKDVTAALNDSIMRIVTGTVTSGGSTAFSTFNGQTATAAYTLTIADIPSHSHGHGAGAAFAHFVSGTAPAPAFTGVKGSGAYTSSQSAASTATGATGGGGAHSHGMTTAIKYNDFIIASKN